MQSVQGVGRGIAVVVSLAAAALVLALAAPTEVGAQTREFTGKIDKINKKKMIVDNRKGDKVSFVRVDETVVEGADRSEWKDLKKSDWVAVSWKMIDKPRKAYKVVVLPPRDEAGVDE